MFFSTSKKLIQNTKDFLDIKPYTFATHSVKQSDIFYGWGRKKSGLTAITLSTKYQTKYSLLEDGFIRSLGLNSPSFSLLEDDVGIYYDASSPSKLENILNSYHFHADTALMEQSKQAMALIKKHHISKYNHAPDIPDAYFKEDNKPKILIIAQTSGDASLEYGLAQHFSTKEIIEDALRENPSSSIYLKIHPDVLSGKKSSDMQRHDIPKTCTIIEEDINPMSLLKHFDKVYTKTSGMGMEALILGLEVVCYGLPYYAGWGLTTDKQLSTRRTRLLSRQELFAGAYLLYPRYYNPYTHKDSDIIEVLETLVKYRKVSQQNSGDLYFFGFSRWKRKNTLPFFTSLEKNAIHFCSTLKDAQKKGLKDQDKIYIWGKKPFLALESYAQAQNIPFFRVEDGFIRSVSLGSDLTKAYSLVVDHRGIYFDPSSQSDLEHLLSTYHFDDALLKRAKQLQDYLIKNKISKYNIDQDKKLTLSSHRKGQMVIMVPGQVEDDASILYGARGMTNIELLKKTREHTPQAYIIYKPHPDVLSGNRKGYIPTKQVMHYANEIISKASLDSVLEVSDEIHTMTSLVGLEALIRGKKVYTYGLPFYAGWGLTTDQQSSSRRTRTLTLDALVAASFLLYPRYLHPKTNQFCEIEVLLAEIDKEKNRYNSDTLYRYYIQSRNVVSRKIQLVIKVLLGE